jgi:lysophospholipase L1-like esterase
MLHVYIRVLFVLALFAVGVAAVPSQPSSAAVSAPSSWLVAQAPVFAPVQTDIPYEQLPIYGSPDCSPNTKFITIPGNILQLQPESSYLTCAVQTAYGQQSSTDGKVKRFDTSVAGPVKTSAGSTLNPAPMPGSRHIMSFVGGTGGVNAYIFKDFIKNSDTILQSNGSLFFQLKSSVSSIPVKDSSGSLFSFADPRFSENGKWMIGDVPQSGMTRVNTETGETLIFGPPYNHQNGIKPRFISAISGDGRYAVVSDFSYDVFRLYDLSTCIPNTDPAKQSSCQSRDLLPLANTQINGIKAVRNLRFSTNFSIQVYAQYLAPDNKLKYGFYKLTAAGEKESLLDYLALGDSFTSGEGAYNYRNGTDTRDPFNKCHLSLSSYPFLLAARSNLNAAQSVACSGAKMKDIYFADGQRTYQTDEKQSVGKEDASFDPEIYLGYLVGYRPQNDFVERAKPSNVTLSISGNDIGFGQILAGCLGPGTCFTDPQDLVNLVHTINSKYEDMVNTYRRVKDSAGTGANIYILGYPVLADPKGDCAVNVRLDRQELQFANQLVSYINAVVKRAAEKAGVRYIDIENVLAGHRLCETVSSDVAVNGLTAGDDKTASIPLRLADRNLDVYITGRESYHPNALGHRLYADAVAVATANFSIKNPYPVFSLLDPVLADAVPVISGISTNLIPKKLVFDDKITNNILLAAANDLKANSLKALSDASLVIRSDNTKQIVGSYKANDSGEIIISFAVPPSISKGMQQIELQGKNIAGEDIIIQKSVYIASSATDIDGDGITNNQEKCLVVNPANIDSDRDGTDDACDNFIGNPPAGPPISTSLQAEHNTNTHSGNNPGSILPVATLSQTADPVGNSLVLGTAASANPPPLDAKDYRSAHIGLPGYQIPNLYMILGVITLLICLFSWRRWWRKRA